MQSTSIHLFMFSKYYPGMGYAHTHIFTPRGNYGGEQKAENLERTDSSPSSGSTQGPQSHEAAVLPAEPPAVLYKHETL